MDEEEDQDTFEDQINRIIESRRLLTNASYLAFTATPKNKTLELFGTPDPQPDGTVKHLPFHNYTMKQAIEEGFIMDVLTNYTPIRRYFNLVKSIDDNPQFDSKRAQRKLRQYVENHEYAIAQKAAIIVDHFNDSVFAPKKMGGQARAMVVVDGVDRAIRYYNAIRELLHQRELPFRALIAFSGSRKLDDQEVSEALLNGFPESSTADRFQEDPYRILICADKFQTGYDEPLLHTMYVDKHLSGIRAVQTLSRLNRFHPKKSDTFVLDFMNTTEVIQESFADYYRTTILSDETDPDKLHDLKGGLDQAQVYSQEEIDGLVPEIPGREGPVHVRAHPGAVRREVREALRERAGEVQGVREVIHPALWVPVANPAIHQRWVGETVYLPELPHTETAGARRAGPVPGDTGSR